MGDQKQHGLHVTNTDEEEKDCDIFEVNLMKKIVFFIFYGRLILFLFLLFFVYFEDFTTAEGEGGRKVTQLAAKKPIQRVQERKIMEHSN